MMLSTSVTAFAKDNEFELPIEGAGCYMAADYSGLHAGTPLCIIGEQKSAFLVEDKDGRQYTVPQNYVLINLPDVLPSVVYKNTNGDKAMYRSSGHDLEGVTGEKLYDSFYMNERLGHEEYVMPVMYEMAKKISLTQHDALMHGDTLVIYETYRPYDTQMQVKDALAAAMETYKDMEKGINSSPWDKSWFIAQSLSNHQKGCAMDVSLAKVVRKEECQYEKYVYYDVVKYQEDEMPTKMHELSAKAVAFAWPVDSKSKTAWKQVPPAESMNEAALLLQAYCTEAGMSPLASEWWHFNDLDARQNAVARGGFHLEAPLSK